MRALASRNAVCPRGALVVLWCLIAIGLGAFLFGILSESPRQAWVALHINFVFWFVLAAATAGFSAVFQICNAQWARPIRRLFESAVGFLRWSWIPLVVLFFGKEFLFIWAIEPKYRKGIWLEPNFVYLRDFFAVMILIWIISRLVSLSVTRDKKASELLDTRDENNKAALTESIYGLSRQIAILSPVIVIVYSILMSLFAFDQLMSADPVWYSTLYGVFVFMSGVYAAMATVSIGVWLARGLEPTYFKYVKPSTLHDLGKLLFGFGIFWAYLFWSHYLPIWYGNIPEFTGWVIERLRLEPWHSVSWFVFGCCFIVPFFLGLSRDVKQVPVLLAGTGLLVLMGLWLQYYVLFVPSFSPTVVPLNIYDLLLTLGFLGAFVLTSVQFLAKNPLIPFGDVLISRRSSS